MQVAQALAAQAALAFLQTLLLTQLEELESLSDRPILSGPPNPSDQLVASLSPQSVAVMREPAGRDFDAWNFAALESVALSVPVANQVDAACVEKLD